MTDREKLLAAWAKASAARDKADAAWNTAWPMRNKARAELDAYDLAHPTPPKGAKP